MKALNGALLAASVGTIMAVMGTLPAAAAPIDFTWSPEATTPIPTVGGSIVNADNFTITDFSTITVTDNAGDFTENGALNITNFYNGINSVTASGLGSTYSLYYLFNATGNQGGPIPTAPGSSVTGTYSSLTYTLYAVNGAVTVSGDTPVAGSIALAYGSLTGDPAGNTVQLQNNNSGLSAAANIEVTLDPCTAVGADGGVCTGDESLFFTSPPASDAVLQFGNFNASGQIVTQPSPNQIMITGGGGNISETLAPVPEPLTLSLFGAGLAGAAALRRRRSKKA